MNRDDIIRMAREAGCIPRRHPEYDNDVQVFATPDVLERFAALVAAAKDAEHQQTLALQQRSYEREIQLEVEAEREACAALLEANGMRCGEESLSRLILETNAAAIRARTP